MKMLKRVKHYGTRMILAVVFVLPLIAGFTGPVAADDGDGSSGAVYTMTNAASGNEVVVFKRSANGSLSMMNTYPTDGLGTGAGLGSQGAIALSHNGRWLFVVNAGSNNVSLFAVKARQLELLGYLTQAVRYPSA